MFPPIEGDSSSDSSHKSADGVLINPSSSEEDDKLSRQSSEYFSASEDEPPPASGEQQQEDGEDEDAYRLRVYGTKDYTGEPTIKDAASASFQRFSKRFSQELTQRRSSIAEALPKTPSGWTVLASTVLSAVLGYEISLQRQLTQPPLTIGQLPKGTVIADIYNKLTATEDSILSRSIQPSLFVGTRGLISSTASYVLPGPSSKEEFLRFREIISSSQDGAKFAVDWETQQSRNQSNQQRQDEILNGPVESPVIIILHGINNDASFGYMRSLQRTFAKRGWHACAMNFRSCGGVSLNTPRSYNASYTGDLRNLVLHVAGRMAPNTPVFLVGNSLGANLVTKVRTSGAMIAAEECQNDESSSLYDVYTCFSRI